MNKGSMSDCLHLCSLIHLRGRKGQSIGGILNHIFLTKHGGATWSTIEPQSYWIIIFSTLLRFNENIMYFSSCVIQDEIARIDMSLKMVSVPLLLYLWLQERELPDHSCQHMMLTSESLLQLTMLSLTFLWWFINISTNVWYDDNSFRIHYHFYYYN